MKRYVNIMLGLSVAGIVFSVLLLLEYYYPSVELMKMICSPEVARGCNYIAQSAYSSIGGIPFAAFGIFYYLLFFFVLMFLDTVGEEQSHKLAGILDIMIVPGILTDISLGFVMIYLHAFCALCFATYCINLVLLLTLFLLHRRLKKGLFAVLREFWSVLCEAPSSMFGRVIILFSVLSFVLLTATVYSMNSAISLRSGKESRQARIQAFVEDFYMAEVENVDFPETVLVLGNPDAPLKIRVFSDFLCSACHHLAESERIILARYPDKVAFYFYNYPLEKDCNKDMEVTHYPGACLAAKFHLAAAESGLYPDFYERHFERYDSMSENPYTEKQALEGLDQTAQESLRSKSESKDTEQVIQRDLALARSLGVNATPTIFINGRRMVGAPGLEALDIIVKKELGI